MPSTVAPSGGSKTQPADDQFNWQQQWYPLAPVSYLDRAKPTPYTVLGRRLVVWYHAPSQQWRALEDRWPHRLAPLSEGRIEPASGNLQCSYHGWQFGGDGRCASIPQADSPQQEATACGSQRSCVAAFPVRQEQGMLWVWMEAGPGAAAASQLRPLPLPAELLSSGGDGATPAGSLLGGWYQRELPLSAEYLLENLLDPSHIHFAHSGVIGSPSRAGSIPLHLAGPLTSQGGFQLHMDRQWQGRAGRQGGRGQQQAREIPGLVDLGEAAPAGGSGSVPAVTRFVPPGLVCPGTSRVFTAYSATGLPPVLQSALRSDALAPLLHAFQFLADLGAHQVIDGDAVHIHQQERTVRQEGRRSYFMPAAADRGVMLLHRWLDEYAGGGPQYFPGPGAASSGMGAAASKPLSRQEVLDRYEQHTKHCPSCRQVLAPLE
ncbi:hypothetical protein CHLNCDRAFT_137587 [Chlorella variabilis]|uniref:Rieske domain-containing protein n=1 Tax=Chlorella variabilis TaxID=554065 RepID=E1Z414_CHLVA|nr:hypothetical protein CHLNCDRAFT_137587 [Chlorella variabilis]EFN58973.1 hypothetical protein CHLNCDRAFT_137587 [Chlorella variabilis]|eukprot:XP_005851075.1 hypothetical protein CHLNCDRAFT_137587 [Chlorella variabilis]